VALRRANDWKKLRRKSGTLVPGGADIYPPLEEVYLQQTKDSSE
jgi:hypothetical protein